MTNFPGKIFFTTLLFPIDTVLTGMPKPVIGESCTTSIKDFAIFPHKKKKKCTV